MQRYYFFLNNPFRNCKSFMISNEFVQQKKMANLKTIKNAIYIYK